jgi:hypothetical protein
MREPSRDELRRIAQRTWDTLAAAGFAGTDPYDGLNSRLLAPALKRSRLLRLAVIQGVKRSPVDLRPMLRVPPGLNPKGLALVLQGAAEFPELDSAGNHRAWLGEAILCLASRANGTPAFGDRSIIPGTAQRLAADPTAMPAAIGWGYDFPWQSKAFLQPAYHPTVVATSFAIDALADADIPAWRAATVAAARFVAEHLHRHEDADGLCFSYSPDDRTRVYNASLFGARILAQAAPLAPQGDAWRSDAERAVAWVMARQAADGSWIYGEADHWRWIDNLHTGFNLETIHRVAALLGTDRWDDGLAAGLAYYRRNLFETDGTPRYYSTTRWPLDPHSFAQGALTFLRLARFAPDALEFAGRILARGVDELWDEKRGGFRFQKHQGHAQGIIHMRWSQAWLLRALCAYVAATDPKTSSTNER